MNFGGPVWHASAASGAGDAVAWAMAEKALEGVGDASLGEWRQRGESAVHLRRRLSADEQGDLTVRDIRGSDEERQRQDALFHEAPHLRALMGRLGIT